ncbi:Holliday junction branch migration DNA helicase RuvB [Patescibacteria group bacterium]|nr:Holliday junction branch migration DNA helicase RuvB [Patescibacteria group bacterium]
MEKHDNEQFLDTTLRPQTWSDYIGQEKLKTTLRVIIEAAKKRGESLEHLLLYGNSGLGKTSLAQVIAREMGAKMTFCSGTSLERAGDVASLLTNLQDKEVLFIDECHRLPRATLETLYSAMEDYKLHLVLGKGPMARTMELSLPRFTLIAATTKMAQLPSPFRNRFGAIFQLNFYEQKDIERIVERSAAILRVQLSPQAIAAIASRSRFTPRVANRILKRVRDVATVKNIPMVDEKVAEQAFGFLEIDELGLEPDDRKILRAIIQKFSGGPVGIQALAAMVAEEQETILDVYEPYLLQLGFLERTPRGRIATKRAYQHLNIALPQKGLL